MVEETDCARSRIMGYFVATNMEKPQMLTTT